MDGIKYFPVRQLEVLFTEKCNLNCSYCFEKDKHTGAMTLDDFRAIIEGDNPVMTEFYPFGGEPFLDISLVTEFCDMIENSKMDRGRKDAMLKSVRFQITNGTLALQHLDIIKKYGLILQISVDGPKDVHDRNRVYHDGRGSFDEVMDAANKLKEAGVQVTIHGAISRSAFPDLARIVQFFFKTIADWEGVDSAIEQVGQNIFQVTFEDNYTDDDVDIFLDQMMTMCEWIMYNEEYDLTYQQRCKFLSNFLLRRGSGCIAGNKMFAMDRQHNLYPCHRLAFVSDREQFSLGSLVGPRNFKNYQLFNSFLQISKDACMYSSTLNNIEWKGTLAWLNWCPAANAENGQSPYHQHSKHNALIAEINAFVPEVADYFKVDLERYHSSQSGTNCNNQN